MKIIIKKLRDIIRRRTKRTVGQSMESVIDSLNPTLIGWFGLFKHAHRWAFKGVDGFVPRRLRAILRQQDKRPGMGRCYSDHIMSDRLSTLPVELLAMVGKHLTSQERRKLAAADKRMHSVFHQSNLHVNFLECVAYGQQDKAERLLSQVFQGQPAKIQAALLHQGTFTDYSGRTFHCSAYEYAYWAKDTHMCRMLERYMDEETKAQMLVRIDAIEANGLAYQQNGQEHRSAHFDFTSLKEAEQRYINRHDAWVDTGNWVGMDFAWGDVGKAQRDVPAHVAQEYCRTDRSFDPRPEFNEATLPRKLTFYNRTTARGYSWFPLAASTWFPLAASNSGLGFDFVFARAGWGHGQGMRGLCGLASFDLAAIIRLDEVRTVDLTQSREHLNPPAMSQSMNV
jgi:hypothetical protein